MGRDLNAVWNWQPRNQGCSFISTISTRELSGDTPLIVRPFWVNISLKRLLNSNLCLCLSEILSLPYAAMANVPSATLHGKAPSLIRSEEHTSELQSHLNLVC